MENRCVVCRELSTRTLGRCSICKQPCHSKCAGKKKDGPCDLCRIEEQLAGEQGPVVSQQTAAKVSSQASPQPPQRRGRVTRLAKSTEPLNRGPLGSSTPAGSRAPAQIDSSATVSLPFNISGHARRAAGGQGQTAPAGTARRASISQASDKSPSVGVKRVVKPQAPSKPKSSLPNLQDKPASLTDDHKCDNSVNGSANNVLAKPNGTLQIVSPPLGDHSLEGITNILIPVSTLELLFQRFDMLERQLDELKIPGGRVPVTHSTATEPVVLNCHNCKNSAELAAGVTDLQGIIDKQNIVLDDLNVNSKLLLEENLLIRAKLDNALSSSNTLQCAHRDIQCRGDDRAESDRNFSTGSSMQTAANNAQLFSRPRHGSAGDGTDASSSECYEVIINGILKKDIEPTSNTVAKVAFAVLRTVLPSLEKDDVLGVRVLRSRGPSERIANTAEGGLESSTGVSPSCVVRLSSVGLVRQIMRARRALANNYLTTNDIDPQLLGEASATCMQGRKIYINEMLPQEKFKLFKNLRPIAQGLGFKYVWHAGGRFLARRKGGERAHAFTTAADL